MRVLVVGASGMIGSTVLRVLSERADWEVYGSIRDEGVKRFFSENVAEYIVSGVDVLQPDALISILGRVRPDVVVNCAGLTKHKAEAEEPLSALPINSLMPHRLASLCRLLGARLIHISTDCVFSGDKGFYVEDDCTDAKDVYGRSKALGEPTSPGAITLRTSTIGHELQSKFGLLDWFLSQTGQCRGYTRAIFSGLPTVIFARVIRDVVIPNESLSGLYHVAAKPITKFDLLNMIAVVYGKKMEIIPDDHLVLDRSLDSTRFHVATGYIAPDWADLIRLMYEYR